MLFVMAGGGTGGHVVPSLAVAAELRKRGHDALFIGTRQGMEARLAPAAGYEIEWIEIGGLKRVGAVRQMRTGWQLPASVWRSRAILRHRRADGVFSMGGYVAGPVMLAAWLCAAPVILMEPNAMPGFAGRMMGRAVKKALISFEEARPYFPAGIAELTGLPVRQAFFEVPRRAPGTVPFTVLVTGGSRGSRALNQASREVWPLLAEQAADVRLILQAGESSAAELAESFMKTGLAGRVTAFIDDMPAAYAEADLVVSRSGAGAVAELAAAGKPSLLVPFPFAADDHQRHNAESLAKAGAAIVIPETDFSGQRLFEEIQRLRRSPERLEAMSAAARGRARRGAATRAADLLEEYAKPN